MQKAIEAPHVHFAVLGDRGNGVDRLSLIGTLDRSTLTLLEDEVATVSHVDRALVLDLHNLVEVGVDAVRALLAMAHGRPAQAGCCSRSCRGSVRRLRPRGRVRPSAPTSPPCSPRGTEHGSRSTAPIRPGSARQARLGIGSPRGGVRHVEGSDPGAPSRANGALVARPIDGQMKTTRRTQMRTCTSCGRYTTFVLDDPAGGWYVCIECGRYA